MGQRACVEPPDVLQGNGARYHRVLCGAASPEKSREAGRVVLSFPHSSHCSSGGSCDQPCCGGVCVVCVCFNPFYNAAI